MKLPLQNIVDIIQETLLEHGDNILKIWDQVKRLLSVVEKLAQIDQSLHDRITRLEKLVINDTNR